MKKLLKEFKEFAMRGNVLDMAIGVVIGGAFGKIVTSLVTDIITPLISLLLGKVDLSNLSISFPSQTPDGKPILLAYGSFIQSIIDFLIIAFSIFMVIKLMNRFHKKKEETPPPPPEPDKQEVLLTEIRDLLKERTEK